MTSFSTGLSLDDPEWMRAAYASGAEERGATAAAAAASSNSSSSASAPKRRKTKHVSTGEPPRALPSIPEGAADPSAATSASAPAYLPMAAFMRDFPHTSLDSTCELAMAKLDTAKVTITPKSAAGGPGNKRNMQQRGDLAIMADIRAQNVAVLSEHKKDLNVVQTRQLHYDASQAVPLEQELLQKANDVLRAPEFATGANGALLSHQEASTMLRCKRALLPVFSAVHETTLLRISAGRWTLPNLGARDFPPCCYGIHCVGSKGPWEIPGLTEPIVLTRGMTPLEYRALLEHNTQPTGQQPCVLCHRKHLTHAVSLLRLGVRPGHGQTLAQPDAVYQMWRNKEDEPGGYFRRYVFHPNPHEVVIDPLANYHPSLLAAGRDPVTGAWSIGQEQMVWRPAPLLPRNVVGESVSSF